MSLQDIADVSTIAQFILWIAITFGGSAIAIQYFRRTRPVWKRLAKNLGREVSVVSTEGQPMEHEAEMLDHVGFFKVKQLSADPKNVNLLDSSSLIVVGYSPESKTYKATFEYARNHRMPIIVFSGKHRLSNDDRDKLKEYSFSSLCETDLRLVSDVFAVMSTFQNVK
jgi:hypothetical protein